MTRLPGAVLSAIALGAALACMPGAGPSPTASPARQAYELWVMDQADTSPAGGGTLYIFRGDDLVGDRAPAPAASVNLAQAALGVGDGVGRRPHMLLFNSSYSHAAIANVATGHVYVMRASDRRIVASVRMTPGAGGMTQAHAAMVTPRDDAIVVMNQNGKKLQRISADFRGDVYRLDTAADLDLNALQDATHPDNAPICAVFTADGRYLLVTLRGGGLYAVDYAASPMRVAATVGNADVAPNGCGGLARGDHVWLNSGGGTPTTPRSYNLYQVPRTPCPRLSR
jgi:hypothetical protein